MQKLFFDTRILDKTARERYALSEELMMENAASALEEAVKKNLGEKCGAVIVLCGPGNNGADGYALARRVAGWTEVHVISMGSPASTLCKTQAKRAKKAGVGVTAWGQKSGKKKGKSGLSCFESLLNGTWNDANGTGGAGGAGACVIVDCIFGSGFHGELAEEVKELFAAVNGSCAEGGVPYKIACDVPSGLRADGSVAEGAFCADCTVTMGALKTCLYSDSAKDVTGSVVCSNLGLSRTMFENCGFDKNGEYYQSAAGSRAGKGGVDGEVRGIGLAAAAAELREKIDAVSPKAFLLEEEDLMLPVREKNLVNKGTYGHAAVVCGDKCGAACIASEAALSFGAGLVTIVHMPGGVDKTELPSVPAALMTGADFPANTTAVALGMGLGRETNTEAEPYFAWLSDPAHRHIPAVLDADVFYSPLLPAFLAGRCQSAQESGTSPLLVVTPHPKELQSLLSVCGLGDFSVSDCVNNRLELAELFCKSYPGVVLIAKGANPVISVFESGRMQNYINPHGSPALAKAGSGDVLSGLVCSLLAQGRTALDAALNASLAHALASQKVKQNFALTPSALIQNIGEL